MSFLTRRDIANDRTLVNALNIMEEEWKSLSSIKLAGEVSKDSYVQLLIAIRVFYLVGGSP